MLNMLWLLQRHRADKKRLRIRTSLICKDETGMAALVVATVLTLCLCLMVCIHSANAETTMYIVTEKDPLNIRFEPSAGARIEYRLLRGDTVDVVAINDGWATVIIAQDRLYCRAEYLSDKPPLDEPLLCVVNANGSVRIRQEPSSDGKRIGKVQPGQTVAVVGWVNGWARLTNGRGYIDGAFLEVANGE